MVVVMSLVTVKPKFQVTIPAKLRKGINLHEGDLLDATLVEGGILLRPKEVVDREVVAEKAESIFRDMPVSPEDTKTEDGVMEDAVSEISKARKQRRKLNS
jgi:AbrB family looped-hinge helix DNA binding protein